MKKFLKFVVENVSFEQVAAALGGGMANVCSHELREGGEFERFLGEHGLVGVPIVLMATHSMGGRDWTFVEGREPAFYEEKCFNGGWHAVTAEDATFLRLTSATSGSVLVAERASQYTQSWIVSLEAPLQEDGEPYRGSYWKAFHEAFGLEVHVDWEDLKILPAIG